MLVIYIFGAAVACFLIYVVFLAICSLFVNPGKEYSEHSNFYRVLLNSATLLAMKIVRVHVKVYGMENVPTNVKPLFVGNHVSNYDPIVTWYVFKKWKPAFVSKTANFKIPVFGRIIRKCCFMEIDRENPRNAIKTICNAAELLKKQDVSVGVYPEGTRSKSCKLLPFHNGVFKIAQKANAPLVVVHISETEKIYKNIPWKHTDVQIKVVDVMSAEELASMRSEEIGKRVREALEKEGKSVWNSIL